MLTPKDRRDRHKAVEAVRQRRVDNVRALAARYPTVSAFCRAIGQDSALYYAIAGENPRRNIGEILARDIEQNLGLTDGWLDQKHPTNNTASELV